MPNGTWVVGEMAKAPRAEGFKWSMTAAPAIEKGGKTLCLLILRTHLGSKRI